MGRRVPAQFIGEGESKRCSLYTVVTLNNGLTPRGILQYVEDLFRRADRAPLGCELYDAASHFTRLADHPEVGVLRSRKTGLIHDFVP